MKLISLNIWEGHRFDDLMRFVEREKGDTDVFCFQEVLSSNVARQLDMGRSNIYEELASRLIGHTGNFFSIQEHFSLDKQIKEDTTLGHAIFVRKEYAVTDAGFIFFKGGYNSLIGEEINTLGYGFSHVTISIDNKKFVVVSVHGISLPGDKLDNAERIRQSEILKEFIDKQEHPVVVAGDFNLMPETQSVAIISQGMRNLINEYKIQDTRGTVAHEKFPNSPQYFADFAFVSPTIDMQSFEVPNIPASDHLPLILRFSLP